MVTVEWSLRCQAHPNFIRWTICNGNKPRVIFARVLGLIAILAGFVTAIVLTPEFRRSWLARNGFNWFLDWHFDLDRCVEGHVYCPSRYAPPPSPSMGTFQRRL